jgi:hypothetical protein
MLPQDRGRGSEGRRRFRNSIGQHAGDPGFARLDTQTTAAIGLEEPLAPSDATCLAVLADLAREDFPLLNAAGRTRGAYPFSAPVTVTFTAGHAAREPVGLDT